jgi:hypothetical protein
VKEQMKENHGNLLCQIGTSSLRQGNVKYSIDLKTDNKPRWDIKFLALLLS